MNAPWDDERARLRFHLELQQGFWFALVAADDRAARDGLRAQARGWAEELGVPFHEHVPPHADVVGQVLHDLKGAGLHWVVVDAPDAALAEEAMGRLFLALNERREALRRNLSGGLVVEGPGRAKVLLRNLAPDLFSVRACVVEPAGPSPEVHGQAPWWLGDAPNDRASVREWGQPGLPWSRWAIPADGAPEEARAALEAARRLEDRAGDGARRSEVNALSRAVEALLAQGWVTEAEPVAERMMELARSLCEAAPPPSGGVPAVTASDAWARSMLAEAYEASAAIAHARGDIVGARDLGRRALELRLALVGDQPLDASTATRHADVARAHGWLGELALQAGDLTEAATSLDVARSIREALVASFGGRDEFRADLALSWSLVGDLRLDRGDPDGAVEAFDRAVAQRRALAAAHPDQPRAQAVLGIALGRRSLAEAAREDLAAARADAEESRDLLRSACDADPGNVAWQGWLATAWSRLGDAVRAQGDAASARKAWEEALAIRRALCEGDPENARWHRALAVVLDRLAEAALARGDLDEARSLSDEALDVADQIGWQEPANADFQLGLARARLVSSEVAHAAGRVEDAARLADLAREAHARVEALGAGGWRVRRLGERLRALDPSARGTP